MGFSAIKNLSWLLIQLLLLLIEQGTNSLSHWTPIKLTYCLQWQVLVPNSCAFTFSFSSKFTSTTLMRTADDTAAWYLSPSVSVCHTHCHTAKTVKHVVKLPHRRVAPPIYSVVPISDMFAKFHRTASTMAWNTRWLWKICWNSTNIWLYLGNDTINLKQGYHICKPDLVCDKKRKSSSHMRYDYISDCF